jgi:hypothetical protein
MRAWWSYSPWHSLVKRAEEVLEEAAKEQRFEPGREGVRREVPWEALARWRSSLVIATVCLGGSAIGALAVGPPPWHPEGDFLAVLWQVEATMVGLGLALIVFALQSGATSPGLRRDLALSLSFPAAVHLGLLLTVLTGVAAAVADGPFGQWLALAVAVAAAVWSLALFAAIRDAISVADPVERINARRSRLLRATQNVLRRELLRNVSTSLLQADVQAAGGEFSALMFAREASSDALIRAGRDGQIADVNRRRLLATVRNASRKGVRLEVWLRLWERLTKDTPIGQPAETPPQSWRRALQRSIDVRPAEAVGDLRIEIDRLHVEARMSVGPDTTALDAVLEAYDAVLEGYALGWRRYVPALTQEHVSDFLEGSGVPFDAIQRATYDLTEAALQAGALDALRTLLFHPAHLVAKSVDWKAPAYLRIAQLPQHAYTAIMTTDISAALRRRVADLPWLYLVETLEFSLPTRGRPYVEDVNTEHLREARWALRRGLISVLRRTIEHSDIANFKEGLRRWRIAEEDHERPEGPLVIRCPIPLAWEIVRRQGSGQLEDAGGWLRLVANDISVPELVAAIEGQLGGDERLADLGSWVSADLPSHEVHMIDYQSDLLRALLLMVALRLDLARPVPPFKIGSHLYSIRDRFDQVVTEVKGNAPRLESAYAVDRLVDRVDAFAEAHRRAILEHEKAERDRIRQTRIGRDAVSAFGDALRGALAESDLRKALSEFGAIESVVDRPPRRLRLVGSRLVDKVFFIAPADSSGAKSIGEMYGRGLSEAEQKQFVRSLAVGRPQAFGARTVTERLLTAVDNMARAGHDEVAILVPQTWELTSTLESEGKFVRSWPRPAGHLGDLAGHPVYDLGDWTARWAAVIARPGAVSLRQYALPNGESIESEVTEIDDAVASRLIAEGVTVDGDASETINERLKLRVQVKVAEGVEFRVDSTLVVRVALPTYVLHER